MGIHRHTHTMEYYSAIKIWNSAICSNGDGPEMFYASWNKSDKEWQILYDITYMWNLKNNTNEHILIAKQKQTHKYWEQTSGYQWGEKSREGQG